MFFNGFGQFNFGWMNFGFTPFYNPFSFNMPQFQIFQSPVFNFTPDWNSGFDTFTRSKESSELDNYNSIKGNTLANIALNRAPGNIGYCAKYVQEAINIAGLGNYTTANADQMVNVLRQNPNFKEISTEDTDVDSLPAGCVLVYDSQVRSEDEIYGHTEFTTGDGYGVSDGITEELDPNPSAIFIPV